MHDSSAIRAARKRPPFWLAGVVQVAKRVGLAKPMLALAFSETQSEKRNARAFAGYRPTEHDVFVATFAKSGTNWMMQIAEQVAHRGASEFEHIQDSIPWPDSPVGEMLPLDDPRPLERSPTGLRVIKTHLAPAHVPYDEKATYVSVLRDPKEVMVSAYHFLGGLFGVLSHVDSDDWFELGMKPGALMTAWAVQTTGFWSWRDRPNAVVPTYNEALAERIGERSGLSRSGNSAL